MADTQTPPDLNKVAPYPKTGDAEAMARHYTVQAYAAYCRLHGHPGMTVSIERGPDGTLPPASETALRDFGNAAHHAFELYTLAYLWREANGKLSMPGDQIATILLEAADNGEIAYDDLGEWLEEDGIDPETVVRAVEAEKTGATA